jgi:hypothetical protein
MKAVTPPHAEGAVPVEVRLLGQTYGTFFLFGYWRGRETLLIPVAVDILGAFGSRWTSDVWVFNDTDEATNLFPEVCTFIGAVYPCGNRMMVAAHGALRLPLAARREANNPELYLSPLTDILARLHFSVRVRDLANPEDVGVEIPIARRSDFRRGRLELLNVPVSDRFRSLLRIYDEMNFLNAGVTVRAYDMGTGTFLAQRKLVQFLPTDGPVRATLLLHDFLGIPEVRGHQSVRLEIEEDDPNASLWAMLTLTENATQRVTVLTSQ